MKNYITWARNSTLFCLQHWPNTWKLLQIPTSYNSPFPKINSFFSILSLFCGLLVGLNIHYFKVYLETFPWNSRARISCCLYFLQLCNDHIWLREVGKRKHFRFHPSTWITKRNWKRHKETCSALPTHTSFFSAYIYKVCSAA